MSKLMEAWLVQCVLSTSATVSSPCHPFLPFFNKQGRTEHLLAQQVDDIEAGRDVALVGFCLLFPHLEVQIISLPCFEVENILRFTPVMFG